MLDAQTIQAGVGDGIEFAMTMKVLNTGIA